MVPAASYDEFQKVLQYPPIKVKRSVFRGDHLVKDVEALNRLVTEHQNDPISLKTRHFYASLNEWLSKKIDVCSYF